MCGIYGFNWNNKVLLKTVGKLLSHRGPNQEGFYTDNNVSLYHRRLSILDLSDDGIQPMFDSKNEIGIIFNGEIYNFQEIREDLSKIGYKFKSKTDTEVIIYSYREWGEKCFEKFNGMFALVIYDFKKKRLILARDRLGIKPLYYYLNGDNFVFGSELKVIMKSGIKKEINFNSLYHYLNFGYSPRDKSILKNVFKLKAGHYMIYDLKNKKISFLKKYWNLSFNSKLDLSEKELCYKIREELEKSVKLRLISDVPVGAFLSGGVDSSIITSIISKYKNDLKTFSISFDKAEYDESKFAKMVSKKFNTIHHEIKFSSKDVKLLLDDLTIFFDEPFGDSSMIPMYLVSKFASNEVTVCLSGDGGDELFGGYTSYYFFKKLRYQNFLPKFFSNFFYFNLNYLRNKYSNYYIDRLTSFFELSRLNDSDKFIRIMSNINENDMNKIINFKYSKNKSKNFFKYSNYLDNLTNYDIHNYLSEDILTKVDRASMGASIEARVPILDYNVVELSARIDSKFKIFGSEKKYILKKAYEGIIPKNILYREKKGFSVPLNYYFKNDLKNLIDEKVFKFEGHNFFNTNELQKLFYHNDSKREYSQLIWSILMFNLWWEKWMIE